MKLGEHLHVKISEFAKAILALLDPFLLHLLEFLQEMTREFRLFGPEQRNVKDQAITKAEAMKASSHLDLSVWAFFVADLYSAARNAEKLGCIPLPNKKEHQELTGSLRILLGLLDILFRLHSQNERVSGDSGSLRYI